MKELITTNDVRVLLDDEDYEYFKQWDWNLCGWAVRRCDKRNTVYTLHVEIMIKAGLHEDGKEVDHKDGNQLNLQKENMRMATHQQNMMNSKKRSNCTSKYKGVYWNKRLSKWVASIHFDGKGEHLGCFESEIEAAKYYNKFAKIYFGEFARLNPV